MVVNLKRSSNLLDNTILHNNDPLPHGHGLDLVVGDINHGGLEASVEFGDLRAHLDAHFGVQVGEGLVKQEDTGLANDGSPYRNPLALPAGEGLGLSLEIVGDAQNLRRIRDALANLLLGVFSQFQPKSHVLINRHVGVERVVLKDHGDIALSRLQVIDNARANGDVTA